MITRRIARIVAAAAVMSLAGAGSMASAEPRTFNVTMDNMNFGQMPTDAKVGDTIIWINQDTVEHSASAKDGSFDLRILPGKRGRTVLKKAGTIPVYCVMHPMMRTTLKVAA